MRRSNCTFNTNNHFFFFFFFHWCGARYPLKTYSEQTMVARHTTKLKSGTESHIQRYRPLEYHMKQYKSCSHSQRFVHHSPNLSKFQIKSDSQRLIIKLVIILNIQSIFYSNRNPSILQHLIHTMVQILLYIFWFTLLNKIFVET